MTSAISLPSPAERAYSTTFVSLDAGLTGAEALEKMQSEQARSATHAIVKRREGDAIYFYLFAYAPTLNRLLGYSRNALRRETLVPLLDLHEFRQSPTVGEQDAPLIGAVVLRGTEVLGFVADGSPSSIDVPPHDEKFSVVFGAQPGRAHELGGTRDEMLEAHRRSERRSTPLPERTIGRTSKDEERPRISLPAPQTSDSDSPRITHTGRSSTRDTRWFDVDAGTELEQIIGSPETLGGDAVEFDVRSGAVPELTVEAGGVDERPEDTPPTKRPVAASPRFFNARTPDRVALNAQTYVIVQVAGEAVPTMAGSSTAAKPIGDFIGDLTVDVHAPGLKAIGPTTLTLQVPAVGDSESLRFGFAAPRSGMHQIDVMAWNGSAQVAGVSLHIAVEIDSVTPGANQAVGNLDMREPEEGEYTLDVAMDDETRRYRFQLRSDQKDVWPPMWSEPLLSDRQRTYEATLANINAQARNLFGLQPQDQAVWLRGLGSLLFEQLVPEKLRALLVERKNKIRVLNILSEADSTPWELLFLLDPESGEGDFLSESTTVARWRYGTGPSRALNHADKVLVLPASAPPEAQSELQALQSVLGATNTIGDLSGLNKLVCEGAFDVLHFAAHNVSIPATLGGAYVPFGKHRWDITSLAAVPPNKYKSRKPLVFMNACTTSGTSAMYTELSSWADRFLKCGSGAFIGTLWEVRDSSARLFSEAFYQQLMQGQTLGKAMQVARAKLRVANPGDPTPLAYTLYGNPLARLEAP